MTELQLLTAVWRYAGIVVKLSADFQISICLAANSSPKTRTTPSRKPLPAIIGRQRGMLKTETSKRRQKN